MLAGSNDENVAESCGEGVSTGVSDVSDVEGTWMLLNVGEDSDSANIVTSGDVDVCSLFELEDSVDISTLKVKLIIIK